jgi:hypothetical protein
VEPGKDGKPAVRNGLGMLVSGPDGEALSPDDFGNLLHRIARGAATDADKTIFVSRKTLHDDEVPALSKVATVSRPAPLPPRQPLADTGGVSGDRAAEKPIPTTANAFQQSAPATEEQSTGSVSWGWLIAAGALVGLILGLFLLLR